MYMADVSFLCVSGLVLWVRFHINHIKLFCLSGSNDESQVYDVRETVEKNVPLISLF